MALDLGAMAYMWSPSGFVAPVTWLLVAYFTLQALLWGSDRMREVDHRALFAGSLVLTPSAPAAAFAGPGGPATVSLSHAPAVAVEAAEPLVCFRDLRVSMSLMTLGMAYMFAAMQLLA
jgi:hypothetical protein